MASWSIHDNKELTAKYQILGHIGSGSYADVYRAHRKADGLEVALKEVHDHQSACREIEALSNLVGYPHVVQLLEYLWLSDDSVVLVLEFLCSDLSAVINRRRKHQRPAASDVKGSSSYAGMADPCMAEMEASWSSDIEARSQIWAAAAPGTWMQEFASALHFEASSHRMAYDAHGIFNSDDAPVLEARVHQEVAKYVTNSHYAQAVPGVEGVAMDTCDRLDSPNDNLESSADERKQQDVFDEAEVKGWMIQLLKGVASCHSEGFLHRDLKPSNMLISASGVLKIADFGQARVLGPQGKVSSMADGDTISQPLQASDQRETAQALEEGEKSRIVYAVSQPQAESADAFEQKEQRRIASLVATFHKGTVERRMDVDDAETSSSPLLIKGIAEMQSQESSFHVICNTEERVSTPGLDILLLKDIADNGATAEQVPALHAQENNVMGSGLVCDHQNMKVLGKSKCLHSSSDDKNALSQDYCGEDCGFESGEEDDSRQKAILSSDVEHNWTSDDLARFEWNAGVEYSYVVDRGVSENSAEFGSEVGYYKEEAASEYTGCVGTRWYRAPELLFGATTYGMGIDMWAVGCMFGELLLGKPVFPGCSDIDQLSRIVRVLGNPNEECWPGVSNLPDYGKISFADDRNGYSLRQHIKEGSEEAHDLLRKLITYNPESRLTAADALKHPYFQVEPHPMGANELRVPSPGEMDDGSMHSF